MCALQYPLATQSAFGLGIKFLREDHFGMGLGNCPVFRAFVGEYESSLSKVLVPLTGAELGPKKPYEISYL
jgi:hypothetical protein